MATPFSFDPLDLETRRSPFPVYARGRREQPVLEHTGLPLRVFSVFRYADVQAILRDPERWSSRLTLGQRMQALSELPPPSLLGLDPPEHTRLRGLVNKAFTPRMVQGLAPRIRELTDALLDAALKAREVDLVESLTVPLPVTVIAEIIGIPAQDRVRFKGWSDRAAANLGLFLLSSRVDPARVKQQLDLIAEMSAYFAELADERRRRPREDLLTGLVQAEHEGSKLTHEEMIGLLVLLLVAGNETTTTLIGNAVLELLAHPGELERLRAEPELVPGAVDEVLRFAAPVQFDPRRAAEPAELHGVKIDAGDFVLCWIGSANRDEEVFEAPDVFHVGRARNPHLSFGFGPHFCLGASLARLEAQTAVGALLERTRRFERLGGEPLPLHPSPVFRGVTRLPLRLEAA